MMTRHARMLKRFGLVRIELPAAHAAVMDDRLRWFLEAHEPFYLRSLESQIRAYGRDCYLQGLIDGNQVRPMVDLLGGNIDVHA